MQKRSLRMFNTACILAGLSFAAIAWGVPAKAVRVKVTRHAGSRQKVSAGVRVHWLEFETETYGAVTPSLLMSVN